MGNLLWRKGSEDLEKGEAEKEGQRTEREVAQGERTRDGGRVGWGGWMREANSPLKNQQAICTWQQQVMEADDDISCC